MSGNGHGLIGCRTEGREKLLETLRRLDPVLTSSSINTTSHEPIRVDRCRPAEYDGVTEELHRRRLRQRDDAPHAGLRSTRHISQMSRPGIGMSSG